MFLSVSMQKIKQDYRRGIESLNLTHALLELDRVEAVI